MNCKVETNLPLGNLICEQVQHWLAKVEVRVLDNRKEKAEDGSATEIFTMFFELDEGGFDDEDAKVKKKAEAILRELGYCNCGIIATNLRPYEYDCGFKFIKGK